MIQICAWCEQEGQQDIYEKMAGRLPGQISHGICRNHALRLRHGYRRTLLRRTVAPFPHSSKSPSNHNIH